MEAALKVIPPVVFLAVLAFLVVMWRQVIKRYSATMGQTSSVLDRYKKAEAMTERQLAISEELLTLHRENNDLLRRLLDKP